MLSKPNLRTKVGKAMDKFLRSFKGTNVWDVDRLLAIDGKSVYGSFYTANLFMFNECLYIIIDSQFRDVFEKNNTDIIEITNGEMTKVIDDYNKHCKTTQLKEELEHIRKHLDFYQLSDHEKRVDQLEEVLELKEYFDEEPLNK